MHMATWASKLILANGLRRGGRFLTRCVPMIGPIRF